MVSFERLVECRCTYADLKALFEFAEQALPHNGTAPACCAWWRSNCTFEQEPYGRVRLRLNNRTARCAAASHARQPPPLAPSSPLSPSHPRPWPPPPPSSFDLLRLLTPPALTLVAQLRGAKHCLLEALVFVTGWTLDNRNCLCAPPPRALLGRTLDP